MEDTRIVCIQASVAGAATDEVDLLRRDGVVLDVLPAEGHGLCPPPRPDAVLAAALRARVDDVRAIVVVAADGAVLEAGRRAGAGMLVGVGSPDVDWPRGVLRIGHLGDLPALLRDGRPPSPPEPVAGVATAVRSSPPGDVVLRVEGLHIAYGQTVAVDGVDLTVARGEIFGLLGPNGAGKTSTLSAVEGLLRPRDGTVSLDGIDVLRQPTRARARMGVQLQATSFQPRLTLRQIVRLYAGLYGVAMDAAAADGALADVGLGPEAGREYRHLSGGQKQRLSLQVAVIHRPALLLLDEPTSGLDPQSRRQLWSRIESIRRDGGSVLLTTHSMEEAQSVCDRVAIMDRGRILTVGSPTELIGLHRDDESVRSVAHGEVTLEDVFVGLTGSEIRD